MDKGHLAAAYGEFFMNACVVNEDGGHHVPGTIPAKDRLLCNAPVDLEAYIRSENRQPDAGGGGGGGYRYYM